MIWYLYRLYSILSYKIFANFLVLYILCLIYFTSSWYLLIPYLKYASPLSFFLLMTTSLPSVSMSLLLFCYICWLTLFFYIPHISENIRYLSCSVRLSMIHTLQFCPCCCKWQNFVHFFFFWYTLLDLQISWLVFSSCFINLWFLLML